MKKIISCIAAGALALGLFTGCAAKNGGEVVSVESVSMITGVGAAGLADSYAGKVVSGETAELKKDADKTVLEVFVREGDMVKAGDILFSYDTEAMQLSLDKLYLDRESYENTIAAAESEIEELESQRSKASSSDQLSYTLQIDARKADIREAEYNMALKDKEIASMEASMEKTEVTSPIDGRIMSAGSTEDDSDLSGDMSGSGTSDAFVTVMDVSSYRVEGHINELNRGAVTEGMRVIVRSRTEADRYWTGVIDSIDWEKPVQNNSGMMVYGGETDDMTASSKYPFYVVLDSTEDLLLGQHVYIEPDLGQEDGAPGLMLPAWYITEDGCIWAADARDKLEKRAVELGAYDPDTDEYEILSGLDYTDYIAFPTEGLAEGMDVVYYDESSFGGEDFGFDPVWEEVYGYDEGLYDYDFEAGEVSGELEVGEASYGDGDTEDGLFAEDAVPMEDAEG